MRPWTRRKQTHAGTLERWNAGNALADHALAFILDQGGQIDKASELYISVLEENSANRMYARALAELYLCVGSNDAALKTVAFLPDLRAQIQGALIEKEPVEEYLATDHKVAWPDMEAALLKFYLRDIEAALPHVKSSLEAYEVTGPAAISPLMIIRYMTHAHVLCVSKDPGCEVLFAKIEDFFNDLTPQTAKSYDAFIANAAVNVLLGEEDQAKDWLEAAFEAGHVFVHLKRHPTFDALEDNARYQALTKSMEVKASAYREKLHGSAAFASK